MLFPTVYLYMDGIYGIFTSSRIFKIKFGRFEHNVVSQYEFVKMEKQEDSVGG